MGIVYLATCLVNNKQYVGKTIHGLNSRRDCHLKKSRGTGHCVFHKALRKYGGAKFKWDVLHYSDDEEELLSLEIMEIQTRSTMTPDGYNLTAGGQGLAGFKHTMTEEWRKKNQIAFLGRKHSKETKSRMSKTRTGRKLSDKHKANIIAGRRIALDGPKGVAYRNKLSACVKGKPKSEEHKERLRQAVIAYHASRRILK